MIHDLWYKNAVVYSLDVETFLDADGDGIGDFEGLSRRLDYLDASVSTRYGSRRSSRRRARTMATTSPTTTASTRVSARAVTSSNSCARRTAAASAS
jgi:hypothetical protein